MKVKYLALAIPGVLLTTPLFAAEIYNKAGNKLDLYGLVSGLRYFSDDKSQDGDRSYMRVGFKGETQISALLTGYGQWQSQFNTNQAESESDSMFTRLGFAGIKAGRYGSFDYGRSTGVLYDALRQILGYFDARILNKPEAIVGDVSEKVTDGKLTDEATRRFLSRQLAAFTAFAQQ